jgi:hypothetical protein
LPHIAFLSLAKKRYRLVTMKGRDRQPGRHADTCTSRYTLAVPRFHQFSDEAAVALLGELPPESGVMNTESVVLVIAAILALDAVGVAVFIRRRRSRRLASQQGEAAWFHGSTGSGTEAPVTENVPGSFVGRRRAPWPILAIVFTSIGLVLALVAGISAAMVTEGKSAHADGTVIELRPSGRGYRAVVEFAAPMGATIRFTSSVSSNPPPAQIGEHVDVRYNPNNPRDATINTYWQIWFLPTLFGILCAPFVLIGFAFGIVTLTVRRKSIHRS